MATIKERVQALEKENTELKQKIELHTIAIGGLINKAALEALNEKNDKIFKALQDHDQYTNAEIADLRAKIEDDIEGKIVGMQTEMRQSFTKADDRLDRVDDRLDRVDNRLDRVEGILAQILDRLPEKP